MGSSKKHKEKDRDRDRERKRDREKRHDKDKHKQRRRSRSPRDRDERYERRKEDVDSETERKKSRGVYDDDDDDGLLQYAMEESTREEMISEPPSNQRAGGDVSLSIEETNKMRIKLGLKPLQVDDSSDKSEEKKTSLLDDVHVPAINIREKEEQEKMRRKLEEIREKRKLYKKLNKVKVLGDSDSDDESAASWVVKSRQKEKEKEMAAKRAQMLAEMDEEFGIGELINEEFGPKSKSYSSKDLRGLKVEHDQTTFKEGVTTILTLKDQGVLDEEDEVLYNINIEDKEKAEKNIEKRKKKSDYQPYDESDENEMFKMKGVLEKYDEEIEGATKKSFVLESGGKFDASKEDDLETMKAKLRKQMVSLEMERPKVASEYYTEEEMVKFKKPKKKRKVRKREVLKADDLETITTGSMTGAGDHGSRKMKSRSRGADSENYGEESMEIAPIEPSNEENFYNPEIQDDHDIVLEDDDAQLELEIALQRSRRAKVKKDLSGADKVAQVLATASRQETSDDTQGASIVIDSTSEFCRTLGEIPTYGLSGNREEEEEEDAEAEMDIDKEHEPQGGWEWVKAQDDKKNQNAEQLEEDSHVLDEEPVVGSGIAAALQLATKKGLLNPQGKRKREEKFVAELPSVGVIDEDKMRGDDKDRSRSGRDRERDRDYDRDRDRYRVEKDGYKPNIKLDYVDEHGRQMTPKEAFRYLSHRFHGKMPAKLKTEKRSKKIQEEVSMQKMSSVDTPLNTAALLKEKQKESQSPYLILSGGGNTLSAGTTISKKK
ncbi:U4/U6.U5 tri-snRNP-associated protein 1-like [Actinia tenebrosa]|uniref:U4/U6.U5 tri-snRNP-associated protein 1-like n=1 Tax=Actinia tenebrosa TaxID=6105 RepID=A0A6P8I2V2_ACTTE|nr:U4/U6.U5 tri-snRNP-associated protein 1-like [Actinia tenebrosa]